MGKWQDRFSFINLVQFFLILQLPNIGTCPSALRQRFASTWPQISFTLGPKMEVLVESIE